MGLGAIGCFDHQQGTLTTWEPGASGVQEPNFVVRPGAPEGEGYLLTIVNRLAENRSDLAILNAQPAGGGPLAVLKLPVRVRSTFHGMWVPSSASGNGAVRCMRTAAANLPGWRGLPVIEDIELEGPRGGRSARAHRSERHLPYRCARGGEWRTGDARPVVLGHEGAGVVEEIGAGVTSLKAGDHVVLSGSSCGHCASCQHNLPSYCAQMYPRNFGGLRIDGSSAYSQNGAPLFGHFFGQSSFAKHTVVARAHGGESAARRAAGDSWAARVRRDHRHRAQ